MLLNFFFFMSTVFAFENSLVGYGSSDAVLPSKNQELFYLGFELALQKSRLSEDIMSRIITSSVNNGSALGAQKAVENLIANKVELIVGFPTSHEALLAAKIASANNKFAIFAGAGHEDLAKFGPKILTTGESMDRSVTSTLAFIKKNVYGTKGIVVVNPFAVFSQNQADKIKEINSKNFKLKLDFAYLNQNKTLSEEDLKKIEKSNFIFITPYADESVKFLEQFNKNKIDLPIITNSSWTTGDLESIRRFLVQRKSPIYSSSLWIKGSKESLTFENLVRSTYGREAVAEISYGYDLGIIVKSILTELPKKFTSDDVVNFIKNKKCFSNTTSGKICFSPNGGHAERKLFFVKFNKSNFSVIGTN
ncbi:MAG: ABC transporter substrate-binding protein [Bdellovibrionaceae bacterium]|nr:ABC transporter substrate-binding protein [Pseudobdellovibrionaceae bacterium]NUM58525.1 ABC transporter substrate-binding protein [Pseudobdellovibrionaceae bacterium]